MTNKEKKKFIITQTNLVLKYEKKYKNPNDIIEHYEEYYDDFMKNLSYCIPNKLYKYRSCSQQNIQSFENDEVWFATPNSFNDTIDSTIDFDLEKEIDYIKNNKTECIKLLIIEMMKMLLRSFEITWDDKFLEEISNCINDDKVDYNRLANLLDRKLNINNANEIFNIINSKFTDSDYNMFMKAFNKEAESFISINDKIKKDILIYSMSESSDVKSMWGLYAQNSEGFCIEYELSGQDELTKQMKGNLSPIYYGEREKIEIIDILISSLFKKDDINCLAGIPLDAYVKMHLSTKTKNLDWEKEKEWRISLSNDNNNLRYFPYAKSIILGENISKDNEQKLIDIAKRKGLDIYKREFTKSKSNIQINKL